MRQLNISFAGGEVTPEFWGRIDDGMYQTGLAKCQNFIVQPHGPLKARPGFMYVATSPSGYPISGMPNSPARLIPFRFNADQTMVIEMGSAPSGYFRFHTFGQTLVSGSEPYSVAHPYTADQIPHIRYAQSADVLTLCHPAHPPRELRRYGALDWRLEDIDFNPPDPGGSGFSWTSSSTLALNHIYDYKVTVVYNAGTVSEVESAPFVKIYGVKGNLNGSVAENVINWNRPSNLDASYEATIRYRIYKSQGGIYGFVGESEGDSPTFIDDNIAADTGNTPPINREVFGSAGNYPGAVGYYEQRRVFAGSINGPQYVWMTRSGTEKDFRYSIPSKDDDAIEFRIAGENNRIGHVVPLSNLVLLSGGTEWRVLPSSGEVLTPPPSLRPQSYVGASYATPVVVDNTLIFASARGGRLREMSYDSQRAAGYVSGDLALRAPHLFDGYEVKDLAFQRTPVPIIWSVSSSGSLIGLTYVPDQKVGAFHEHTTRNGTFHSCCVVSEGDDDVLYVSVSRMVNGHFKHYIERMQPYSEFVNSPCVADCSAQFYYDPPQNKVTGMDWMSYMPGMAVRADGAVHPRALLYSGFIDLDYPAARISAGIPISFVAQTLPVVLNTQAAQAAGVGVPKAVSSVSLKVKDSFGFWAGPSLTDLSYAGDQMTAALGDAPSGFTGDVTVPITSTWTDNGQIHIKHEDPTPLTILAMALEIEAGG